MLNVQELAQEIIHYANAHRLSVCTAESCSAGHLATTFAKCEGAAAAYQGGVVAYTPDAKIRVLSVPEDAIRDGTTVCDVVAEAMALGAVKKFGANFGVAITGVAGPKPDEEGNPVGLVYCGVARSDGGTRHVKLELGNKSPHEIIEQACLASLALLRDFAFS